VALEAAEGVQQWTPFFVWDELGMSSNAVLVLCFHLTGKYSQSLLAQMQARVQ
jgi:hypothetical protein